LLARTDREIGGIVCSDVIPLLPKYKAGNIDDPQLLARLRKHLTGCQRCTAHYRELTVQEISHRPTTAQVTLLREAAAR